MSAVGAGGAGRQEACGRVKSGGLDVTAARHSESPGPHERCVTHPAKGVCDKKHLFEEGKEGEDSLDKVVFLWSFHFF